MSPSALQNNEPHQVLPHSIIAYDLNDAIGRPEYVTLCCDKENMKVFLNIEDWCDLNVWVCLQEVMFYAQHLKINGLWCAKHVDELHDVCFQISEGIPMKGNMMIWDGQVREYVPFTQFLFIHSNKFLKCDDGYDIIDRESNHVDNGVAVRKPEGVVIVDMFNDGTTFYPAYDYQDDEDCYSITASVGSDTIITTDQFQQAWIDLMDEWQIN